MSLPDTNTIIYKYLVPTVTPGAFSGDPRLALIALVGARIYCPRLPENAVLPAIGFFTRGGVSTPYIPDMPSPSVQFDCWAKDVEVGGVITTRGSIIARQVYRALYDALQGIQNVTVTIGAVTYKIKSAREEVQGQDLIDTEIQNYFRVLTFFEIIVST